MPNCTEQKQWKVLYRPFSKSSSRDISCVGAKHHASSHNPKFPNILAFRTGNRCREEVK